MIQPFTSVMINTKAYGAELNAFRPKSHINVLVEGNTNICNRLLVEVVPSINTLTHQNCTSKVKVYNSSSTPKTIGKGVKLAHCSINFEEFELENNISLNLITTDHIEIMCSKITDLAPKQLSEARSLLSEFKDVFSVSNGIIGRTDIL